MKKALESARLEHHVLSESHFNRFQSNKLLKWLIDNPKVDLGDGETSTLFFAIRGMRRLGAYLFGICFYIESTDDESLVFLPSKRLADRYGLMEENVVDSIEGILSFLKQFVASVIQYTREQASFSEKQFQHFLLSRLDNLKCMDQSIALIPIDIEFNVYLDNNRVRGVGTSRIDILALKPKNCIVYIEVKYDDTAFFGESGITQHFIDITKHVSYRSQELYDMINQLNILFNRGFEIDISREYTIEYMTLCGYTAYTSHTGISEKYNVIDGLAQLMSKRNHEELIARGIIVSSDEARPLQIQMAELKEIRNIKSSIILVEIDRGVVTNRSIVRLADITRLMSTSYVNREFRLHRNRILNYANNLHR
jgi:hypothetical protein